MFTLDYNLQMKDAGLVAADAAWQVAAADKILDMGAGLFEGYVVILPTAIEIDSTDESYGLSIQGSSSATFASDFTALAELYIGAAAAALVLGDVGAVANKQIVIPFRNEFQGTVYRYIRGYTNVTGAIATGINFVAYLTKGRTM